MLDNKETIVIDNGSKITKAGLSGERIPQSVFHSLVGYKKYLTIDIKIHQKQKIIGEEAFLKSCVLVVTYPIEHGIIKNWNDYESILDHTFHNELKVDPSEHPILISETSLNPKINREKMIQLMFETFNVPSFLSCNQSVLSLYSSGRETGIVLDSGYDVTQIVPVYEGYSIFHGMNRIELGGNNITMYLQKKLEDNGIQCSLESKKDILSDVKEKNCYVALDYEEELLKKSSIDENEYNSLSDEMKIVYNERFNCTEILFKPSLNNLQIEGIDKALFDSIMKCDADIHNNLYSNIVLAGGNSLLKGFPQRIEKEISKLANKNISVSASQNREYSTWIGGSILASSDTFDQMVVNRNEYNEVGSFIVHRKCIF